MRIGEKRFQTFSGHFHSRDRGNAPHTGDGPRLIQRGKMIGRAPALRNNLATRDIGGDGARRRAKSWLWR
jgi:hypothetical protein